MCVADYVPYLSVDKLTVTGIVVLQGCDVEGASPSKCATNARSNGGRTSLRDGVRVDGKWKYQ